MCWKALDATHGIHPRNKGTPDDIIDNEHNTDDLTDVSQHIAANARATDLKSEVALAHSSKNKFVGPVALAHRDFHSLFGSREWVRLGMIDCPVV